MTPEAANELRADGSLPSVQDRVQAGMAFLDEEFPQHVETFDPADFHILNRGREETERGYRRCVLLQATGMEYWFSALNAAGINNEDALELGFYPVGEDRWSEPANNVEFEADITNLNVAWVAAYEARKTA